MDDMQIEANIPDPAQPLESTVATDIQLEDMELDSLSSENQKLRQLMLLHPGTFTGTVYWFLFDN